MKYAVYVEGKAELLFIVDVLQKYSLFNPKNIGFRCINLNSNQMEKMSFPIQGDESAENYYQIVNVNNDNRVISKLKHDIPNLIEQGFHIIIGLRDVYGSSYDAIRGSKQVIDFEKIESLRSKQYAALQLPADADVRLRFAIMEYETLMLSLLDKYVRGAGQELANILESLGIRSDEDFEYSIFHPTKVVENIFDSIGKKYGKHEDDQYSFLSTLTIEDYELLRNSGKCQSFKLLMDSLGL